MSAKGWAKEVEAFCPGVGKGRVWKKEEIQKMDEAAKAELYAWIKDEFDIADDAVEALIEKTLKVLIDLYQLATEYSENRKMKAA